MIPAEQSDVQKMPANSLSDWANSDWQTEMRRAITDVDSLLTALNLPPLRGRDRLTEAETNIELASSQFSVRVPLPYLARMEAGNPNDPLLRQVLPRPEEMDQVAGFDMDAVGDLNAVKTTGLLQKYSGRALIIATGGCAVNCRFCFRRHFPYAEQALNHSQWQSILDALKADPSIQEIILSGGDPLLLSDDRLASMVNDLAAIPHIQRLRVHSRLPVVIPNRITTPLITALSQTRLAAVMVLHINHGNEIDQALQSAVLKLLSDGIPTLNQSVLLAGVNDSYADLRDLSEQLVEARIIPYYIHLLDKVSGTAHFQVSNNKAAELMKRMRESLPGYLCPRWVYEEAGEPAKTPFLS